MFAFDSLRGRYDARSLHLVGQQGGQLLLNLGNGLLLGLAQSSQAEVVSEVLQVEDVPDVEARSDAPPGQVEDGQVAPLQEGDDHVGRDHCRESVGSPLLPVCVVLTRGLGIIRVPEEEVGDAKGVNESVDDVEGPVDLFEAARASKEEERCVELEHSQHHSVVFACHF